MSIVNSLERDDLYVEILLAPIRVCAKYQPKMGKGGTKGTSLEEFLNLYGNDPFYHWIGLDNPLMYAAHKAAGGMTSIYRQVGIGSERLFRQILIDSLGIETHKASWSYEISIPDEYGKIRKKSLYLDGRIEFSDVIEERRDLIREWCHYSAKNLGVSDSIASSLTGVVFEVRQGYKSKDAKRQNADIGNAVVAYTNTYLPCVALMSMQIDVDVIARYRSNRWAFLLGYPDGESPDESLYAFLRDIVGYDLGAFFERNKYRLRNEMSKILMSLLEPKND